ncbi:hypothetical protein [Peromfec virus RodF5_7]|uniref:Uncharacterized protein n=1 Tax=Peromfec virus RodF5_7 TaxID=2929343 RepID=A0A976N2Z7_9VIRU|nr:hypothetical protein [Peromfec virus RodF5_7]
MSKRSLTEIQDMKKYSSMLDLQNRFITEQNRGYKKVEFDRQGRTYYELVQKTTPLGVFEEVVEKDYPITPETVQSFLASTEYKKDPMSHMVEDRVNLGDVTALQDIINDPGAAQQLYGIIENRLREYAEETKQPNAVEENKKEKEDEK